MSEKLSPEQLSLYFYPQCPFCHRVLNTLAQLGYTPDLANSTAGGITLKDTIRDHGAKQALKQGGGKTTVPCLRIERNGEIEWMYESQDIIAFLQENFAE